jgi:hypothetical protein
MNKIEALNKIINKCPMPTRSIFEAEIMSLLDRIEEDAYKRGFEYARDIYTKNICHCLEALQGGKHHSHCSETDTNVGTKGCKSKDEVVNNVVKCKCHTDGKTKCNPYCMPCKAQAW